MDCLEKSASSLLNGVTVPLFQRLRSISNGWTHFAKFGSELLDLLTRFRERAGTIDSLRRVTEFLFHGKLRADSAASFLFRETAGHQTRNLLLRLAPHHDHAVELFIQPGLH